MRLPDFLIIGAMKAGTTTLYRDLLLHPQVFFPLDKEPSNLADDRVMADAGRRSYAALFERARPDQICGEASTAYTKLPDITGVPGRAREVIGSQVKVIYLVREPVSQIISHHYHDWTTGAVACGIDEAVRTEPRYVNYASYATQITPWLETLDPEQVLILRFESYINDRRDTVAGVCRFLGTEPHGGHVQADSVYNRSEGKPVPTGPFAVIQRNPLYRCLIRPSLTPAVREKLRAVLLPKAPPRPDPPALETVDYVLKRVQDDAERLRSMMGRDQALWDFDAVRERHRDAATMTRA
ncbi:MAG: sulfotransferase family protein [Planctomycetota bacterium]|jgi:hypothetical protein